MRLHIVYRPPATHRSRQYAAAERIWFRRSIRLVQKYDQLAHELGRRRGWRVQWSLANRCLYEDGSYSTLGEAPDTCYASRRYFLVREIQGIARFHSSLYGL